MFHKIFRFCEDIHDNSQKTRVGRSLIGFSSNTLVLCERKSYSLMKKSELLPSLFCHERPERITHGRSFVKIDGSESLKVLFKKEQMSKEWREQFPLGHKKGKNCYKQMKNTNFLSNSLVFCERKSGLLSKKSESLFKKEQMSKVRQEQFALGHKKGTNCQKLTKNTIFRANRLFFAINPLESRVNHSHSSFLKCELLTFAL